MYSRYRCNRNTEVKQIYIKTKKIRRDALINLLIEKVLDTQIMLAFGPS